MPPHPQDPTELTLISTMDKNNKKNYRFKSNGVRNRPSRPTPSRPYFESTYSQSTLFPIDTEVTLSSGKFPLTDYTDMQKTYTIGNKQVILAGFSPSCIGIPVVNECNIHVTPPPTTGGRRRRKTKKAHRRRRSSRKRISR